MIPRLPKGFSHPLRIGEGSFASVYRVRQHALDRWVAVKFIHERDRKKRRDLLREARTQAQIKADCIPQIYDAFEWHCNVCIIMQWIRGIPLLSVLDTPLSEEERYFLAHGFIASLANLHTLNFAHRDLKPANIIISPENGIHLVDFGFAKSVHDIHQSIAGVAKGTPAYMAPELWRFGGTVDLMRADVFSAGKILLQILSGTPVVSFTEQLMNENPEKRPSSGLELLALWKAQESITAPRSVSWSGIAGNICSDMLSAKLLLASKELLFAGRHEEAYWLLVESIEENANNADAIQLMSRFSQNGSLRKRSVRKYLILASLLIVALVSAFLVGRRSSEYQVSGKLVRKQERLLLLARDQQNVSSGHCPLKEDTLSISSLKGRVVVKAGPVQGKLLVNNSLMSHADNGFFRIDLMPGTHLLTWLDTAGNVYWFERVSVLPFQIKHVTVTKRGSGES